MSEVPELEFIVYGTYTEPYQPYTVTVKFIRSILRGRYFRPTGSRIILPDEPRLSQECLIYMPTGDSASSRETAKILACQALDYFGIPRDFHAEIVEKIYSQTRIRGYYSTEIFVELNVPTWEECSYDDVRAFLLEYGEDRIIVFGPTEDSGSSQTPAAKSTIDDLERLSFAGDDDEIDCPVCLNVFKEGHQAIRLPCNHIYHPDCILKWLKRSHQCPLCRHELPTDQQIHS